MTDELQAPPIRSRVSGRTVITDRALSRTFAALAAEELGVSAPDVRVRIGDSAGRLAVDVVSPVLVRDALYSAAAPNVLELAAMTRERVQRDGEALSGAVVGRVDVRLTSARIDERRRVR